MMMDLEEIKEFFATMDEEDNDRYYTPNVIKSAVVAAENIKGYVDLYGRTSGVAMGTHGGSGQFEITLEGLGLLVDNYQNLLDTLSLVNTRNAQNENGYKDSVTCKLINTVLKEAYGE